MNAKIQIVGGDGTPFWQMIFSIDGVMIASITPFTVIGQSLQGQPFQEFCRQMGKQLAHGYVLEVEHLPPGPPEWPTSES